MPREQINFPDLLAAGVEATVNLPRSRGDTWREPALHVSWLAQHDEDMEPVAGHVQVAFEADPGYFTMAAEHISDPGTGRTLVYSPALSRSEINRMIRALKRARDQVHGRDE